MKKVSSKSKSSKTKKIDTTKKKKNEDYSIKESYTNMMVDLITGKRDLNQIKDEEYLGKKRKKYKTKSKDKKEDNYDNSDYNPLFAMNNLNKLSGYISSDSDDEMDKRVKIKTSKKGGKKIEEKKTKKEKEVKDSPKKEKKIKTSGRISKKVPDIQFNDKIKNIKNESINNYNNIKKLDDKYNFINKENLYELDNDRVIYENHNSEIVIENYKTGKKNISGKETNELKRIKNNIFISINACNEEIIIFEVEELNLKIIQEIPIPEKDIEDPFLLCTVFNENTFILYNKSEYTSFYIYQNKNLKNGKYNFKLIQKEELEKKAKIYADSHITKIIKINENDILIYVNCDQRPPTNSFIIQMLNSNVPHKEATYFAIYSFIEKTQKFKLKKSFIKLEKALDICTEPVLVNNKYLIYYGEIEEGNEYYILDIEKMNIVYTFILDNDYEHQIFNNFFRENEMSNTLIIKNINEIEQYEIEEKNKKIKMNLIGNIKMDNVRLFKKFNEGIVVNCGYDYYYLFQN